jgi:hypothetical protein
MSARPIVGAEAAEAAPTKKLDEHWCEHPGCKQWGCFGLRLRSNPEVVSL